MKAMTTFGLSCVLTLVVPHLVACDLGDLEDETAGDDGTDDGGTDDAEDEDEGEGDPTGDAADGPDPGADPSSDPGADDDRDPAIPSGLLGLWVVGDSTAMTVYEFREDGRYVRANRGETTFGTCTTVIELAVEGELTVSGDVLELVPQSALKVVDQCGTVTQDDSLPDPTQLGWSLGQDQWGETLTLVDEYGATTFYRG